MLKKLLKYEYKATARIFLGLYLTIILLGLFMGVSLRFAGSDVMERTNVSFSGLMIAGTSFGNSGMTVSAVVYFALNVAMFVLLFVMICQRFYKNLLGNEGYLMHTLPVKPSMLILSKLIMACFWTACSLLVLCVSLLGFVGVVTIGRTLSITWNDVLRMMGLSRYVWTFIPSMVGSFICGLTALYLAMLIGHQMKKGTLWASILAFFLLNTIENWIEMGIGQIIMSTLLKEVYLNGFVDSVLLLMIFVSVAVKLLVATLFFFAAEYLLRKRLNLA